MAESSWYDGLGDALGSGLKTVFSEGLPKYVDAEIESEYRVEQPSRQYEVAPNGQAQQAGEVPKSVMSNPWAIGGAVLAGVAVLAVALKGN